MTRYIATAVCLLVLAVLGYEIWLRDWLESRHCIRLLSEVAEKERRAEALAAQHHPTILDAIPTPSGEVLLVIGPPTESELVCEQLWVLPPVEPTRRRVA